MENLPSNEILPPNERMKQFIRNHNGSIPFDLFMSESLYGNKGYYQERVNIAPEEEDGDFNTYAGNPLFTELVYRHIVPVLEEIDGSRMVEIAGGTGTFKQKFLELAKQDGIDPHYLSLDTSKKLIGLQKEQGGVNALSSVLNLPLAKDSLKGAIFLNELVDALPFKVIRVKKDGDRFKGFEELFYELDEAQNIKAVWKSADSEEIQNYWQRQFKYLKTRGFDPDWDLHDGQLLFFNLNEEKILKELDRVLEQGEIIIIDYGDNVDELIFHDKNKRWGMRMYPRENYEGPEESHKSAYQADITYDVNYTNLILLAKELGLDIEFFGPQRYFMYKNITQQEEKDLVLQKDHPWHAHDSVLNQEGRKGGFKVLILKRKTQQHK